LNQKIEENAGKWKGHFQTMSTTRIPEQVIWVTKYMAKEMRDDKERDGGSQKWDP
jgi:hypothetical protein